MKQSQLFKLHYKSADGRIGGVSKVLFQLLGGELTRAIGGKDKLPEGFFLFCNLALGKCFLEYFQEVFSGETIF